MLNQEIQVYMSLDPLGQRLNKLIAEKRVRNRLLNKQSQILKAKFGIRRSGRQ